MQYKHSSPSTWRDSFSGLLVRRKSVCGSAAAFTLTEILVVMGILLTLAAALIPVANMGIRKGMETKGLNNLRQLAQAQIQYAGENSGSYATAWKQDGDFVWQSKLLPYLGYSQNPTDSAATKALRMDPHTVFNVPDSKPISKRASWEASIGLNPWMTIGDNKGNPGPWNGRTLNVPKLSTIILLGEMPVEINGEGTWPPDWTSRSYNSFNRRGRTRMLMAFCDGHAAACDLKLLYDSVNARPSGEPNLWHWWYQPGVGVANWQ